MNVILLEYSFTEETWAIICFLQLLSNDFSVLAFNLRPAFFEPFFCTGNRLSRPNKPQLDFGRMQAGNVLAKGAKLGEAGLGVLMLEVLAKLKFRFLEVFKHLL